MKFTQQYVEEYYKNNNCILLDNYKNSNTSMKYCCSCGNITHDNFNNFKNKNRRCNNCGIKKSSRSRMLSDQYVDQLFKDRGYVKLELYTGKNNPILYKCNNNHISKISLTNLRAGKRCAKCSNKYKPSQIEVENIFKTENCELLSVYKSNKQILQFKCSCGNIGSTNINRFKNGTRCKKCISRKLSNSKLREKNPNYNLDREYIKNKRKVYSICKRLISRCLNLTNNKKYTKTENILGYTKYELLEHLQTSKLFDFWSKNPAEYHIDHIYPVNAFIEHNIFDLKLINGLDNLQILYKNDNIIKSDKYDKEQFYKKYIGVK